MRDSIRASIIYEGDFPKENIIESIMDYVHFLNGRAPDLIRVFKLFMPHLDPIRKEDVFVCSNLHPNKTFNVNHIASDWRKLDLDRIQSIINDFYDHPTIEEAFRLYIMFELIHPFVDGNGRVGRFIFFENALNIYLSSYLHMKIVKSLHNLLFKPYTKKVRIIVIDDVIYEYLTGQKYKYKEYYDLTLIGQTHEVIREIICILNGGNITDSKHKKRPTSDTRRETRPLGFHPVIPDDQRLNTREERIEERWIDWINQLY